MTVFYDRRTAVYRVVSVDISSAIVKGIAGQSGAGQLGYSGGQLPPLSNTREQYQLDQTVSVTNMS